MIIYGKYFYTKAHKLPDLSEIHDKSDNNDQSLRFNDFLFPNNTKKNKTYGTRDSTNYELASPKSKNEESKSHSEKKISLKLNMNYNKDDEFSGSKKDESKYDYQPEDSFFHNKLEKQPQSIIKTTHHSKHKQKIDYLNEIPQEALNHRITYQYTSPTKNQIEEEIKNNRKKSFTKNKNSDNSISNKKNIFSTPEKSDNKLRISFDLNKSESDNIINDNMIEEEESEFESDENAKDQVVYKSKFNSLTNSKNENLNKYEYFQIEEEEEEGNEIEINQNKNLSNTKQTSYSNANYSHKSASSLPNEEEEFEFNNKYRFSDHNSARQDNGNKNSIATSPFYKPNLQFQQFDNNKEDNELSQSQKIKPPPIGQPQNLSRNNRRKPVSKATNQDFASLQTNEKKVDSSPISFKSTINSQENIKSPQPNDQVNSKSFKNKSPDLNVKQFSSSQSNTRSSKMINDQIGSKSSNKVSPKNKSSSPKMMDEQVGSKSTLNNSPEFNLNSKGFLSSNKKTKSPQISNETSPETIKKTSPNSNSRNNFNSKPSQNIVEKANLRSDKNISSDSSNFSSSYNSSRSLHTFNQQSDLKSSKKSSPDSNSLKNYSSSHSNKRSPQISNQQAGSKSSKKMLSDSNSLKSSSSSQNSSKSSQISSQQKHSKSTQKVSSSSNSFKNNSPTQNGSRSPKNAMDAINLDSAKKKSLNTNSIEPFSSPQIEIDDKKDEEIIYFERLILSDKENLNSDKYSNSEQKNSNEENEQFSSESYNFEENKYNSTAAKEVNASNESVGINDHISIEKHEFENIDIIIEEEEDENEDKNSQKDEEESLVMLSELQNTNDISPLPKKKQSDIPVSFHKLSSDSLNMISSETEINDSLVQVLKPENKTKQLSSTNKSTIFNDEEEEENEEDKFSEEEFPKSNESFSSILSSKKSINNEDFHQSNLISSIENVNDTNLMGIDDPLINNEDEEEDLLENDPLNSKPNNSDDILNPIQDVIFEEDFHVIPTDPNLLASDDSVDNESNQLSVKIDTQLKKFIKSKKNRNDKLSQNVGVKKKNKVLNDSMLSDCSNNGDDMLDEKDQLQSEDIHSSEIRFLLESTDQCKKEQEEEEEEDNESFQEIQSLSQICIENAHILDLGEEEENENEIFDFDDKIEEDENDPIPDVLFDDTKDNANFDENYKNAYENSPLNEIERRELANMELLYNNIKFSHPSIRFGLKSVISFADHLLKKELNDVF